MGNRLEIPMRSRTLKVEWNDLLQTELERLLGSKSVWVEEIGAVTSLAA